GGADGDGVDLLRHLLEHLAVVEVLLRVRVLLGGLVVALVVDVADRDDVLARHVAHVASALAAGADAGDVQLGIGRFFLAVADLATGDPESRSGRAGVGEELSTTAGALTHEWLPF